MMKPKIKAMWIAALRSGEYRQGRGQLREGNTYCCLGVLCDLHAKATGERWERLGRDDNFSYLGQTASLPGAVIQWAGLLTRGGSGDPTIAPRSSDGDHASMQNDNGRSFKQIANLIERNL